MKRAGKRGKRHPPLRPADVRLSAIPAILPHYDSMMSTLSTSPITLAPEIRAVVGSDSPVVDFLSNELALVQRLFEEQLASDLPAVNRLCAHIERYRGKMLRPTLTLLAGAAAHAGSLRVEEAHRVVAAVAEMIHMATLVHDDVLDEAELRRKGATVNYLHGNEAAVLLGDYLISNAFHLCSTLGRPEINRRIGEVTNRLCAGELLQLHHREHWSIDEPTYFEIIERKTATLIGLCCELGAQLSGAESALSASMERAGRELGIAFQIQDDLLDLVGEEPVVGKSLGRDIAKDKLTLPVIYYLARADQRQREEMLRLLGGSDQPQRAAQVRERLLRSGAIESARDEARRRVLGAQELLEGLAPSEARSALTAMARAIVERAR